jgi:hypothetical protein
MKQTIKLKVADALRAKEIINKSLWDINPNWSNHYKRMRSIFWVYKQEVKIDRIHLNLSQNKLSYRLK